MKEIFEFIINEFIITLDVEDSYVFYDATSVTDEDLERLRGLIDEELQQRASDKAGELGTF